MNPAAQKPAGQETSEGCLPAAAMSECHQLQRLNSTRNLNRRWESNVNWFSMYRPEQRHSLLPRITSSGRKPSFSGDLTMAGWVPTECSPGLIWLVKDLYHQFHLNPEIWFTKMWWILSGKLEAVLQLPGAHHSYSVPSLVGVQTIATFQNGCFCLSLEM